MSTPQIPFQQAPTDPSLKDLLDLYRKNILLALSCHHIGTVQSFDATKQTATATINYKKTYFQLDAVTGLYSPVLVDYPIMVDCPVICLGGANGSLTFPITAGDECLILFNDRDMDTWFAGGSNAAVATPRLHSFSDAIILVGLRSLAHVLTNYDTSRVVLQNGTTLVGIGASLIKIANNQYTLNGLLQELITDVQNLVTQTAAITVICAAPASPSSIPVNVAAITAISTQLTATANKIAGLLE